MLYDIRILVKGTPIHPTPKQELSFHLPSLMQYLHLLMWVMLQLLNPPNSSRHIQYVIIQITEHPEPPPLDVSIQVQTVFFLLLSLHYF